MRTLIVSVVMLVGCPVREQGSPNDQTDICTQVLAACTAEPARDISTLAGPVDMLQATVMDDGFAMAWYDSPRGAFFGLADATGVLDSATVTQLAPGGLFPRSAWNGSELGVTYVDEQLDGSRRLIFARFDVTGRIIGDRVVLHTGMDQDPSIAWSPVSRRWAVVWADTDAITALFALVDEGGAIVPGSLQSLGELAQLGGGGGGGNAIIWADAWVAVWSDFERVYLTRFDAAGRMLGIKTVADGVVGPIRASVAASRAGYGVTFMHQQGPDFTVRFVVVARDGTPLPGGQLFEHAMDSAVAWTGCDYAVVYLDSPTAALRGVRITADGANITPIGIAPTAAWFPYVVWDGCRLVVAYMDMYSQTDGHLLML